MEEGTFGSGPYVEVSIGFFTQGGIFMAFSIVHGDIVQMGTDAIVNAANSGLLAGSGFVLARELLDRKIRTASDVEEQLALPVLGVVPNAGGQKEEKDEPTDFWDKIKRMFKIKSR